MQVHTRFIRATEALINKYLNFWLPQSIPQSLFSLVTAFVLATPTEIFNKYLRIVTNLLGFIFKKKTFRLRKSFNIAMAYSRLFPGFQIMELPTQSAGAGFLT